MTLLQHEATSVGPGELRIEVLGHPLRVHTQEGEKALTQAVALLEQTFRDMEQAYKLRWGSTPSALDTSTWMLMGALNLAHRLVCSEQEASQHTQDLEQKLTKLLDDVPDEPLAPGPLFLEGD